MPLLHSDATAQGLWVINSVDPLVLKFNIVGKSLLVSEHNGQCNTIISLHGIQDYITRYTLT